MKRILSAMLAAMMIITLVGCSNDTESELREEIDRLQDEIDDLENERDADSNTDNNATINDIDTNNVETTTNAVAETETAEPEIVCIRVDEAFRFEEIDGGIKIMGTNEEYRNDSISHIIYPAVIDEQPIIEVEYIDWPDQIITVEFEDGYTRIPDYALHAADGLETVIIPDTVVEIGQRAFVNCTGLKEVNIPDSVIKIGERAFYDCGNVVITYHGNTYSGDSIEQLYADINANNAE